MVKFINLYIYNFYSHNADQSVIKRSCLIQGLIKIGLFQPDTSNENKAIPLASNADKNKGKGVLFSDENGKVIDLADLKGKVVFTNFWAAWCPPQIQNSNIM